jgi:hypothetical protein
LTIIKYLTNWKLFLDGKQWRQWSQYQHWRTADIFTLKTICSCITHKMLIVCWHNSDALLCITDARQMLCKLNTGSKPVKQEVNSTVILPPLVFPGCVSAIWCHCNPALPPQHTMLTLQQHSTDAFLVQYWYCVSTILTFCLCNTNATILTLQERNTEACLCYNDTAQRNTDANAVLMLCWN